MKVGTYVDGHEVTYDDQTGHFAIGGTQVTLDSMRGYFRAEEIAWTSPATRDWFDKAFMPTQPINGFKPLFKVKSPTRRTGWIVAGLAVFAVLAIIVTVSGSGQSDSSQTASNAASAPAPSQSSSAQSQPTAQSSSDSGAGTGEVGTTSDSSASDSGSSDGGSSDSADNQASSPDPSLSFSSVKKSGTHDAVIKLPSGVTVGLVKASYSGSDNFVIQTLDSDNQQLDLLVNTIGAYKGTTMFAGGDNGNPVKLQVSASGRWNISIEPVTDVKHMGSRASGKGDQVLYYSGPAADLAINNHGKDNFVVTAIDSDGNSNLLVNEIGSYGGTVPVDAGPEFIVVNSDGGWSMVAQ